jgi:hypothetical protein
MLEWAISAEFDAVKLIVNVSPAAILDTEVAHDGMVIGLVM